MTADYVIVNRRLGSSRSADALLSHHPTRDPASRPPGIDCRCNTNPYPESISLFPSAWPTLNTTLFSPPPLLLPLSPPFSSAFSLLPSQRALLFLITPLFFQHSLSFAPFNYLTYSPVNPPTAAGPYQVGDRCKTNMRTGLQRTTQTPITAA
jgi:hypothetical protein